MKWSDVSSHWPSVFSSLKARFPNLTDDILIAADGNRATLEVAIAQEHELTAAEAREALDEWLQGPMPADARTHETMDNVAAFRAKRYIPEGEDVYADDERFGDDTAEPQPVRRRA